MSVYLYIQVNGFKLNSVYLYIENKFYVFSKQESGKFAYFWLLRLTIFLERLQLLFFLSSGFGSKGEKTPGSSALHNTDHNDRNDDNFCLNHSQYKISCLDPGNDMI